MAQPSGKEFHIGITMAGAISAGAYSAGVFDFLIQALDEWEKARGEEVPNHRAAIKVLTGASAGSIVAGLGTIALACRVPPQKFAKAKPGEQEIQCILPALYEAWVVKPRMVSPGSGLDFLRTTDLAHNGGIVSLLNSDVLGSIRDAALAAGKSEKPAEPRQYLSRTFDIYMTLSNIHGVPYAVTMNGGNFGMLSHGDRAHYRITGLGTWTSPTQFADRDPKRMLEVSDFFGSDAVRCGWETFADCAVSSSAFPAGLAPRVLSADRSEYSDRLWPMSDWTLHGNFQPDWQLYPDQGRQKTLTFLTVDGGLVDNDPFEYARFTLMQDQNTPLEDAGDKADRAVVMIAPFPEAPAIPEGGNIDAEIVAVLSSLMGVVVDQMRFKPNELVLAADEKTFSRFLIAPHRTLPGKSKEEPYAIASGLLGGFGGFLSQPFRDHDFQLGRRNCQMFLRASFALPPDNPIIRAWPPKAREDDRFKALAEPGDPPSFRIIPLLGSAAADVALPDWPRLTHDEFSDLQPRIKERLEAVAAVMIRQKVTQRLQRWLAQWLFFALKGRVLETLKLTLLSNLVLRDQIEGWALPTVWRRGSANAPNPDNVRRVLAQLINPSFDLRTEFSLAKSCQLDVSVVRHVLDLCMGETGKPYEVWRSPMLSPAGEPLYTIASRKPSWFANLPGVRSIRNWFLSPTIGWTPAKGEGHEKELSMTDDVNLQTLRLYLQRARVAITPFGDQPGATDIIENLDALIGPKWKVLVDKKYPVPTSLLDVLNGHVTQLEESVNQSRAWTSIAGHAQATIAALPGNVTTPMDDDD